jgi:hypothetical protein
VSKHIQTDFESYATVTAAATEYNGYYLLSFPSSSAILFADPDTIRMDDMGDGRMSFWKTTGHRADLWLNCNGALDSGYLLSLCNDATPKLTRHDTGTTDDGAAIDAVCQTKYFSFTNFGEYKHFGRIKPKVGQLATATNYFTLTMLAQDGAVGASATINVSSGTGFYSTDLSVPYTLDHKLLSLKLQHNLPNAARLIGYTVDFAKRRY